MLGQWWGSVQQPVDSLPAPTLWLDANDPLDNGTHPADLSALATWFDKSASGNNFTQGTGALQPTFIDNSINGLPAISFGDTPYMGGAVISTVQYTVFVVGICNDISNPRTYFYNGNSGGNGQGVKAVTNPASKNGLLYGGVTWLEDGDPDAGVPHIYNASWNGTVTSYFIDNVSTAISGSASAPNSATTSGTLGADPGGGAALDGMIAELLFYNRALTSDERDAVYTYLSDKWGI